MGDMPFIMFMGMAIMLGGMAPIPIIRSDIMVLPGFIVSSLEGRCLRRLLVWAGPSSTADLRCNLELPGSCHNKKAGFVQPIGRESMS